MRRVMSALAATVMIVLAFALYAVKQDTRRLATRVHELNSLTERAKSDIATLKAEWGHLTDPARIERLARQHLGMRPARPDQYVPSRQIFEPTPSSGERVADSGASRPEDTQ